jgi:hypothetical protein
MDLGVLKLKVNNMIVSQIYGGLGNQLFQYAAGYSLSKRQNVSLKLDIGFYGKQKLRTFELDRFKINYELSTKEEIDRIKKRHYPRIIQSFYYKFQNLLPYYKRNLFNEKDNLYDPNFKKATGSCIINGYWQDHRYFLDFENEIRKMFDLKQEYLSNDYFEILSHVVSSNSVSLHIRRGDYITIGIKTPAIEYYQKAIRFLQQQFSDLKLFVFSDDIEWCKKNLDFQKLNVTYIEPGLGLSGPEEMQLMSKCKHNIIANSTFSWWAAFLNINPEKNVIFPTIMNEMSNPELSLTNWICIE